VSSSTPILLCEYLINLLKPHHLISDTHTSPFDGPIDKMWQRTHCPYDLFDSHTVTPLLKLVLQHSHVVPDCDVRTAVLSHMQHLVVVLSLNALLDEPVLSEVALIVEVRDMLLQEETRFDIVVQQVHMVVLCQFSQEGILYFVV
jgi:hypothetical protein